MTAKTRNGHGHGKSNCKATAEADPYGMTTRKATATATPRANVLAGERVWVEKRVSPLRSSQERELLRSK